MKTKLVQTKDYLLLVDLEAEITAGWTLQLETNEVFNVTEILEPRHLYLDDANNGHWDNFDPWCCRKIIAYYPLIKEVKELDLPLLPNPFKDEDIEKLALKWFVGCNKKDIVFDLGWVKIFEAGYKAAQSKQFSLEDIQKAFVKGALTDLFNTWDISKENFAKEKAEQYIQSLSIQQLPKEFIPKIQSKNTYIINDEGKAELVGTYKY